MKEPAHLPRGAFYVLLLGVICVIPFALAQRTTAKANRPAKIIPLNPLGPRWSTVESPNRGSPGTNQLFATTCASASDCWAVGYSDVGGGSDYSTLIEQWNGSAWTI